MPTLTVRHIIAIRLCKHDRTGCSSCSSALTLTDCMVLRRHNGVRLSVSSDREWPDDHGQHVIYVIHGCPSRPQSLTIIAKGQSWLAPDIITAFLLETSMSCTVRVISPIINNSYDSRHQAIRIESNLMQEKIRDSE